MMRKKKVLQVIGNLKTGGAERVAMNYYSHIDRNKFEFHYLVYKQEIGEYEQEVYDLGGKVIRIDYSKKRMLSFFIELVKLMKQNNYDIVHSHTLFNSGIVLLASKMAKTPKRVAHSHSIRNKIDGSVFNRVYEGIMRKLIINNATDYFACSFEAGCFLYGKKVYNKHGTFIPNGIEVSKFEFNSDARNEIRKDLGIEDKIVLGHVGHLSSVKNQSYLMDLVLALNSNDFVLVLLGEGNSRNLLEDYAIKLGIKNQVLFLGNVDNVNNYLSAFDIFLFPSLFEGLPLSLIEAQSNGLPCIISNQIPTDVIVTDLVRTLPITKESLTQWKNSVLSITRPINSKKYSEKIFNNNFDVKTVGTLIQKLYNETN